MVGPLGLKYYAALPSSARPLGLISRLVTENTLDVSAATILASAPLAARTGFEASYAFTPPSFARNRLLPYDRIWLMSESGEVRFLDLNELGVPHPDRAERAFALSPEGDCLAVADVSRIMLVNIASVTVQDFRVRAVQPVSLTWSASGDSLYFVDRHDTSGPTGLQLDTASGQVHPIPMNPGGGSYWPGHGMVTFKPSTVSTDVLVLRGQDVRSVGSVSVALNPSSRPVCESICVTAQYERTLAGQSAVRGLVTIDVDTGRYGPALALDREQLGWASVLGWTPSGAIRVAFSEGESTYVVEWDVTTGSADVVAKLGVPGLSVHSSQSTERRSSP